MKIAIFHDYFDKKGGGERLVVNLARALDADVFTGYIEKEKTIDTSGIRIHSLGVKGLPQIYRNIKIAKKFEKAKFPMYDFYIFSGVWCISASKNHHPNFLYLHTPMRALYDLNEYFSGKNLGTKIVLGKFARYWKPKDKYNMKQFDSIGTNSENVRNRVLKYYGKSIHKKTKVVYTGVDTKKYKFKKNGYFYLSASRLDPLKRIDIIIRSFNKMPNRKLVIAGTGPDEKRLKRLVKGNNIKFVGGVSDKKLIDLYSKCRATIAANLNEDLGLIAIESHASGKPIVAIKEGGFLETVKEGKNGVFFKDENDIERAVEKLEAINWNNKLIKKTAEKFDIRVFEKNIRAIISEGKA